MPGKKSILLEGGRLGWIGAVVLAGWLAGAEGQQYTLNFSKSSTRMRWSHRLPSWSYSVPVHLAASADSTSMLRISTSASMESILDDRKEGKTWSDNASIRASVNYPILGPKATIGLGGSMSVRNATLTRQKIRNQTFNIRFQYSPLQEGPFKSLRVNVTPGLVTASRASRARVDSTIEERGIQYNASLRVSPALRLAGRKLSHSISLGKTDNTLKNNKNRSESFSTSFGYTWPGEVRTQISLSETRSQIGVTRSVITEEIRGEELMRDTSVVAELAERRNTSLSSSLKFRLGRFEVSNTASYRENLNTNTASDDEDPGNRYFGTDREGKQWNLNASLSGKLTGELIGRTSIRLSGRDERFLPVRLSSGRIFRDPSSDLSNRDLFLNGSLDWQPAERHTLKLAAWVEIKRSENPGSPEQNRDIYTTSSSLTYDGTLSGGLKLSIGLKSSFDHRVNLHAARSSDNSRNRDIGLDISTRYERMGIGFSHRFGISAKRTIYDFDRRLNLEERSRKSNIRRGWSMIHSLRRRFFEHLQLSLRYSYRADDFGRLIAENQTQIVEEDNGDHDVGFGVSYVVDPVFSASVNYTYRLDRQWKHQYLHFQENRFLYRRNRHENLSVGVTYNPGPVTKLTLRGSRSRQRSGTFDSFNVTYSRTI